MSAWARELAAMFDASLSETSTAQGPSDSLRAKSVQSVLDHLVQRAHLLRISRLIDLTPLDTLGLSVFSAVVPNALTDCFTGGKGPDRDTALVSALMEAYELHCFTQPLARGALLAQTLSEARQRGDTVDPNSLPLPIVQSFPAETRFDWLPVLELGARRRVYLPADLFSFAYGNAPSTPASAFATSSGKSAGSSAFDALLHALLELVERDAFVLSQFGNQRALPLDADFVGAATVELAARVAALGVEVYLFELTSDTGVPVVKACLAEPCGFESVHIHKGIAAHVDRHLASYRALLEACQVRLTYFVGSREDVGAGPAPAKELEALREHHASATRAESGVQPADLRDLLGVLDGVLAALQKVGCDRVYVANLSDTRVSLPALAVYVPHLEGLYPDENGGWRLDRRGIAARAAGATSASSRRFAY